MVQHAIAELPPTAHELHQSDSGVRCRKNAGLAEGWDIPVFVWRYGQGCEQTISAHDETVLSIFDEKSLLERIDGRLAGLRGGEGPASIALAHGASRRTYVALRESLVTHFYLSRRFLTSVMAQTNERLVRDPADRIFAIDTRLAKAARDYAARAFDESDPPTPLEMNARSILLAIDILREDKASNENKISRLNKLKSHRIIDMIDENLGSRLSLGDLSAELGYSTSHFLLLFKNTFGVTPHRFLLAKRIDRAKELIKRGSIPLSQIALECGFASQQHFSTLFRRATGVTPSAFRITSS
jgi:AraC-like DNA-binding protein